MLNREKKLMQEAVRVMQFTQTASCWKSRISTDPAGNLEASSTVFSLLRRTQALLPPLGLLLPAVPDDHLVGSPQVGERERHHVHKAGEGGESNDDEAAQDMQLDHPRQRCHKL